MHRAELLFLFAVVSFSEAGGTLRRSNAPKTYPPITVTRTSIAQSASSGQQPILIPRSVGGDPGNYYLISSSRRGEIVVALHKRVGPSGVGYTRTETNCRTLRMRELGYSETSAESIVRKPTEWFEFVRGSSKSDLAKFVCSRRK